MEQNLPVQQELQTNLQETSQSSEAYEKKKNTPLVITVIAIGLLIIVGLVLLAGKWSSMHQRSTSPTTVSTSHTANGKLALAVLGDPLSKFQLQYKLESTLGVFVPPNDPNHPFQPYVQPDKQNTGGYMAAISIKLNNESLNTARTNCSIYLPIDSVFQKKTYVGSLRDGIGNMGTSDDPSGLTSVRGFDEIYMSKTLADRFPQLLFKTSLFKSVTPGLLSIEYLYKITNQPGNNMYDPTKIDFCEIATGIGF